MSLRFRTRKDGSTYTQCRYRIQGREASISFDDHAQALKFQKLIDKVGPAKALEIAKIVVAHDQAITVGEWLTRHIENLTGVEEGTIKKYRAYVNNDFDSLIDMPLAALTPDDVSAWIKALRNRDGSPPSGKTIANKHGLLAGAMKEAVARGYIPSSPCDRVRLPRWDRREMVFLERDEYKLLLSFVPEYWKPLVEFLVQTGARWSEATALQPADVDRAAGTVRIYKAWKTGSEGGGYTMGMTKTVRSVRTINVNQKLLDRLDYSGEWLFTNSGRGRRNATGVVRIHNFHPNVWKPAVKAAQDAGLTKNPRVYDLRHTAASWLINDGTPVPEVQKLLGHENYSTTIDVYFHSDRGSGKRIADTMNRILYTEE
jgi:integrase